MLKNKADNENISKIAALDAAISNSNRQLDLTDILLSCEDVFRLLQDLSRIRKAIKLTVRAALTVDPYYDPNDFFVIKYEDIENVIISMLQFNTFNFKKSEKFFIPKTPYHSRACFATDMNQYIFKCLFSGILSERFLMPRNIYGGNYGFLNFKSTVEMAIILDQFNKRQLEILEEGIFAWVVYVDIKNYYESIRTNLLIDKILGKLSLEGDSRLQLFLSKVITEVNMNCLCDSYLHNFYLLELDESLVNDNWEYLRMTDDIRVFCNTYAESVDALGIIEEQLKLLGLEINQEKMFMLSPTFEYESVEQFGLYWEECIKSKRSNILEFTQLGNYPVENIYSLLPNSFAPNSFGPVGEDRFVRGYPKIQTFLDKINGRSGFESSILKIHSITYSTYETDSEIAKLQLLLTKLVIIRGNHKFQEEVIRTYLFTAFELELSKISYAFKILLDFLAGEIEGGNSHYTFYLFLKIWFFDLNFKIYKIKLKNSISFCESFRDMLELFFTMMCNYNHIYHHYIGSTLRFIFVNRMFRMPNLEIDVNFSGDLTDESYWIYRISQDLTQRNTENDRKAKCVISLLQIWFPKSISVKNV